MLCMLCRRELTWGELLYVDEPVMPAWCAACWAQYLLARVRWAARGGPVVGDRDGSLAR